MLARALKIWRVFYPTIIFSIKEPTLSMIENDKKFFENIIYFDKNN